MAYRSVNISRGMVQPPDNLVKYIEYMSFVCEQRQRLGGLFQCQMIREFPEGTLMVQRFGKQEIMTFTPVIITRKITPKYYAVVKITFNQWVRYTSGTAGSPTSTTIPHAATTVWDLSENTLGYFGIAGTAGSSGSDFFPCDDSDTNFQTWKASLGTSGSSLFASGTESGLDMGYPGNMGAPGNSGLMANIYSPGAYRNESVAPYTYVYDTPSKPSTWGTSGTGGTFGTGLIDTEDYSVSGGRWGSYPWIVHGEFNIKAVYQAMWYRAARSYYMKTNLPGYDGYVGFRTQFIQIAADSLYTAGFAGTSGASYGINWYGPLGSLANGGSSGTFGFVGSHALTQDPSAGITSQDTYIQNIIAPTYSGSMNQYLEQYYERGRNWIRDFLVGQYNDQCIVNICTVTYTPLTEGAIYGVNPSHRDITPGNRTILVSAQALYCGKGPTSSHGYDFVTAGRNPAFESAIIDAINLGYSLNGTCGYDTHDILDLNISIEILQQK